MMSAIIKDIYIEDITAGASIIREVGGTNCGFEVENVEIVNFHTYL